MLLAKLNGETEIEICADWSDITIEKATKLYEIANKFPQSVKEIYALILEEQTPEVISKTQELENSITDLQKIKELPILYGELIKILTTIDKNIINQLIPQQRTDFYNRYLAKFIVGILHFPIDFKPKNITTFEIEGTTYYLPTISKFKVGNTMIQEPMSNATAIEFTEAADFELAAKQLEGGRIEVLANIIAILCRPENEVYDERVSAKRAEMFQEKITMDIAWEVFFCLLEHFSTLKKHFQIFSMLKVFKKEIVANFGNSVGTPKS